MGAYDVYLFWSSLIFFTISIVILFFNIKKQWKHPLLIELLLWLSAIFNFSHAVYLYYALSNEFGYIYIAYDCMLALILIVL